MLTFDQEISFLSVEINDCQLFELIVYLPLCISFSNCLYENLTFFTRMFNVSLNKECLLKMPIDTKDR